MKLGLPIIATLLSFHLWASEPPRFSIMDVGTLENGHYSSPTKLNNRLQLIGRADIFQWFVPFIWEDGLMTALPVPQTALVSSINDRGQWVGSDGSNFIGNVPFPGLATGYTTVAGYDINNDGEFVGALTANWNHSIAFKSDSKSIKLLGFAGVESTAYAINRRGVVVGWSATESGRKKAAFLTEGRAQLIGELPGALFTHAIDVNDQGEVVGTSFFRDAGAYFVDWKSFHYRNGKLRPVGILPGHQFSFVYAINKAGDIVGVSNGPDSSEQKAFLETKGRLYDLNDLVPATEWKFHFGVSINDLGWIAVAAHTDRGDQRALLLKPEKR